MSALPVMAQRTLLGRAFLLLLLTCGCVALLVTGCSKDRDCAATLTCAKVDLDGSAADSTDDDVEAGADDTPDVAVSVPLQVEGADGSEGRDGGGEDGGLTSAADAGPVRADDDDPSDPSGTGGTSSVPVEEQTCSSSDECDAEAPVCDEALDRCVTCLLGDDEGCPPERPFCVGPSNDTSVCVECESQDDCGGLTPFCNLAGECVGCAVGDDCADFPETPHCSDDGECVGCLSEADCGPDGAACDANGQCVSCAIDDDCARFAATPACDTLTGSCVECAANAHCTDPALARCEENVCTSCETADECAQFAGRQACDTSTGECVECASLGDCNEPLAADCVGNRCVPCEFDIACIHIPGGYSVCDGGECVMCTGPKDDYCGSGDTYYVCLSEYRVCADRVPENLVGSADLCEPCLSDAHCSGGKTCVQTELESEIVGWHCQWEIGAEGAPTSCADASPYVESRVTETIDGREVTVCGLRATTCAAVVDHLIRECNPVPYIPDCGDPDFDDALCVQISGTHVCTTRCIDDTDCPSGQSCSSNGWFCLPD